jgi:hypothetical protein
VLTVHSHSSADAEAVLAVAAVLEEQAAHEAQVEAEVELLASAVQDAGARQAETEDAAGEPIVPAEPTASTGNGKKAKGAKRNERPGAPAEGEPPAAAAEEPEEEAPELTVSQVRLQRERLPETAVALMEAIRAAAVTRRLTRQLTLFLIMAGEFTAEGREVSPDLLERTRDAMAAVERELQRAIERERFSPGDQEGLADRIRKRRKELEKLLDRSEAKR